MDGQRRWASQSVTRMITEANTPFRVTVTADRSRVLLNFERSLPAVPAIEELIEPLAGLSIPMTPDLTERIARAREAMAGGVQRGDEIVLVEAIAAQAGAPEQFEPAERFRPDDPEAAGPTDFHRCRLATARAGEVLGRIVPGSSPRAGADVFGEVIPPPDSPEPIFLGEQLVRHDDGTVTTPVAGMVELSERSVTVRELVEISGDVDFSTGDIEAPVSLSIAGTVRSTFAVTADGSVSIGGSLEAARVEATGHVEVTGGIAGRSSGMVIAGGDLSAKFCNGAHLRVAGDVTLRRGCINSCLRAGGCLIIEQGALIGGSAWARGGAEICVLGSDAEAPTRLICGTDPAWLDTRFHAEQLVLRRRQAADNIRARIRGLLQHHADLPEPQQRLAGDLLERARRLDDQAAVLGGLLATEHPGPEVHPRVTVKTMIHAGTMVAISGLACQFTRSVKGPLVIESVPVEGSIELVMVEVGSRRRLLLPAMPFVAEPCDTDGLPLEQRLRELMQELSTIESTAS